MVKVEVAAGGVVVGCVLAEACRAGPSPPELLAQIKAATARASEERDLPWRVARKSAVRDMLRHGKYRPTGRAKPASEYIEREALAGNFPIINVLADINNLVSLETLFPISIVDLVKSESLGFRVRWGKVGESYVFNAAGQVIDLEDLLVAAALPQDRPVASPVKDCQETKTSESTTQAFALVYGPAFLRKEVFEASRQMGDLLSRYALAKVSCWLAEGES